MGGWCVRCVRVGWRRGLWRGRGWGPGAGFVAGAIVGGAIAASRPYPYYYGGYEPGYAYAPGYAYGPAYAPDEGYVAVAPGGGGVYAPAAA